MRYTSGTRLRDVDVIRSNEIERDVLCHLFLKSSMEVSRHFEDREEALCFVFEEKPKIGL